jgi:hypothetical protein
MEASTQTEIILKSIDLKLKEILKNDLSQFKAKNQVVVNVPGPDKKAA